MKRYMVGQLVYGAMLLQSDFVYLLETLYPIKPDIFSLAYTAILN